MTIEERVYDMIVSMEDDEAVVFSKMLVDDLYASDVTGNGRTISRITKSINDELTDEVAEYCHELLNSGEDPEKVLAIAASFALARDEVSKSGTMALSAVSKDSKSKPWKDGESYKFQERDSSGRFGRMTWSEYRANKKAIKFDTKAQQLAAERELRSDRRTGNRHSRQYHSDRVSGQLKPMTASGDRIITGAQSFEQRWHQRSDENTENTSMTPTYNRLQAGGKLARDIGVATGNDKVAVAGAVAEYAGKFGPEAEKVIGPSIRRTAYRYRGTERTPDRRIQGLREQEARRLVESERRSVAPGQMAYNTLSEQERVHASEQAALAYMLGTPKEAGAKTSRTEAAALQGLGESDGSRIPSHRLAELHRKSGKITPSEGILIDAEGNIVAQAVGYAEDHYLPFNLKNLGKLQGGSYVRTRESGGLTTEDIYTGLVAGARSITVASNSGVFTIDFADDLRGARRNSDKARSMVKEYGQLLDAIQSKDVTRHDRAMTPREKIEIRLEVEDELADLNISPEQMKEAVQARISQVENSPRLTREHLAEIKEATSHIEDPRERRAEETEMIESVQEQLSQRTYQLDGRGYAVALQAMKEKYPYFIDNVRFLHKGGTTGDIRHGAAHQFKSGSDRSYVDPRYNRARSQTPGLYGERGSKNTKHSAADRDYQNWSERRTGNGALRPVDAEPEPTPKAKGEGEQATAPQQARTVEELKAQHRSTMSVEAQIKERNTALLDDLNEWGEVLQQAPTNVTDADARRMVQRFMENTPTEREALVAQDQSVRDDLVTAMSTLTENLSPHVREGSTPLPSRYRQTMSSQKTRLGNRPELNVQTAADGASPPLPFTFDPSEVGTLMGNKAALAHLRAGTSDDALHEQSNALRTQLGLAKEAGRSGDDVASLRSQITAIEVARTLKSSGIDINPGTGDDIPMRTEGTVLRSVKQAESAAPTNETPRANMLAQHYIDNPNLPDDDLDRQLYDLLVEDGRDEIDALKVSEWMAQAVTDQRRERHLIRMQSDRQRR